MTVAVRAATVADVPAIAGIYRPAVLVGTGNFEQAPPDDAEMLRRFEALVADVMPYLVAEHAGVVVGYAYAGRYRPRPAYRFTVENSVYVSPSFHRGGVGRALLAALIAAAAARGARQMIAVIGDSPSNPASVALHRRCGFEVAGRLNAVGWKLGAWRDTLLMQRALGAGDGAAPS
jgi:phosphinothricin acetyltransferase